DNKDKLITLAELLLEKEVIFKNDLEVIFGKRAFDNKAPEVIEKISKTINEDTPEETNIENSSET
ncbi:MAG: hypothetical protein HQ490_00370, partial [Lutibacter sp.]|nr:hypothetical protein [Lutibacter sp.]